MALVKCKECGAEISTTAKVCPRCGAKQKRTGLVVMLFLVLIALVVVALLFNTEQPVTHSTLSQTEPSLTVLSSKFEDHLKASDWFIAGNYARQLVQHYPQSEAAKKAAALIPELDAKAKGERTKREEERKAKIAKALAALRKERDVVNGITFYSAPETSQIPDNYWSLYLAVPDRGAPYLRFKFMYYGNQWLFIHTVTLNVDGEKLPDVPLRYSDIKRDNSGGWVWEWYDEAVEDKDLNLFERLIASKKTIIRYTGTQYRQDRILGAEEKRGMRKILDAYRLITVS